MEAHYSPQDIEKTVQTQWQAQRAFEAKEDFSKEKYYCLSQFPYPSGHLHMGHVRVYTIGDVISRYQRLLGKNVLQPMGWDAFGLPAENAAIQHKVPPAKWTYSNIDHMRAQLKSLGLAYDWNRELATCDPSYYRWEQWLFTRLYQKGLVYKKNAVVNWDPVDQTVLANEQVIDGRGWRSGALIERREIAQWFFKITDYAEELLADLENLSGWPEQVVTMQRNWIGRSQGLSVKFPLTNDPMQTINVFTTRADTLMGVTYLAIAAEHPLAKAAAEHNETIRAFVENCKNLKVSEATIATLEKQGVDAGFTVNHPITQVPLPVMIANYVLLDYGTGAVMAVPAHDERDHGFALKYGLPIKQVIAVNDASTHDFEKAAYPEKGILINSDPFNGLNYTQALSIIGDRLSKLKLGEREVNYRLRDWGVSRQRYWGTPIPIIYCEICGTLPVPDEDLPVILPEEVLIDGAGSPLKTLEQFYQTTCPQCGKPANRETDTFDTFVESSWYYLRFTCQDLGDRSMLDDRVKYWLPVDNYVGGIEHAVLHLLYSRFFYKVLRDEGMFNSDEPFTRLLTQGMVIKDGAKMSKSKGNVADPATLIERFGADTIRLFILFAAPPEQSLDWSDSGVEGCHRFLKRLWSYCYEHQAELTEYNQSLANQDKQAINWAKSSPEVREFRFQLNTLLKQIRFDYERQQFNTVVSGCMKLFHLLNDMSIAPTDDELAQKTLCYKTLSILLRLLAPITPHLAQYLWQTLNFGKTIHDSDWPKVANDALQLETALIVVQVNGKLRGKITVPIKATQTEIEALIRGEDKLQTWLEGTTKKVIYVPGKLINFVMGS